MTQGCKPREGPAERRLIRQIWVPDSRESAGQEEAPAGRGGLIAANLRAFESGDPVPDIAES